mmetsp:Transcript_5814/g.36083  ORF Transcript_5814/g.36083 Transcript_5814/m.36083 type:complete len:141 (+) Transcript_5814:1108-1530(+)
MIGPSRKASAVFLEGGKQRQESFKSKRKCLVQMSKNMDSMASSAADLLCSFVSARARLDHSCVGTATLSHMRNCASSSKGVCTLCPVEKCRGLDTIDLQSGEHLFLHIRKGKMKESRGEMYDLAEKSRWCNPVGGCRVGN